jgi:hypothetical protein
MFVIDKDWGPYRKGDVVYHGCIIRVVDAMPEDEDGKLPEDSDIDDPDEWRDVCDDPSADPHSEDDNG